jgi:DNA-binding NtrC family response regulator
MQHRSNMKKAANKPSVLVLDDEKPQQEILSLILEDAGYEVTATGSPKDALEAVRTTDFDLVLTDLKMPEMDGIEFLERVKRLSHQQVVVVITAHGTIASAVEAMKKGAFNYLTKPLQEEPLLAVAERAVEQARLVRENRLLQSQLKDHYSIDNMIGKHGSMQEVFRLIQKVAPSSTTVLIYGESGTGKELVARAIHQLSPRSSLPMQAINCAAIPETLLESELFGYEKGAFTGAYARKKGMVEQADGSTLFLDEIGDLSLPLQAKILRLLQEREIQRLGANHTTQVDVRVVSATHRDLKKMMAEGLFREDLYYRLNTFPIVIPPLRERVTDIPLLVDHFLKKLRSLTEGPAKRVCPAAMDRLLSYHWPGSVRQLESVIERAIILAEGDTIEERDLPQEVLHPFAGANPYAGIDLPDSGLDLEELEKHLLRRAMEKSGGVIARAARLLGLTYRTLQYRLDKYKLNQ